MCNTNPNVIYVLFFVNRCKYTSFLLIMKFFVIFSTKITHRKKANGNLEFSLFISFLFVHNYIFGIISSNEWQDILLISLFIKFRKKVSHLFPIKTKKLLILHSEIRNR